MARAVGVVFSPGGKVYSFDPGELELAWNEHVICQTSRGREHGRVVQATHELPDAELVGALKRVVRRATEEDAERVRLNRGEARQALGVFRELRVEHGLEDVRPVSAEVVFDGSRVVVAYRSETRPDVHAFQRELGKRLGRRVELRAVGPREAARQCGGQGLCGGQMCCTRFPSHEQPITLRMAKDQDLPMSAGRMTGLCGRLRCCLAFEHPLYRSFRDRAPRVGARVGTPHGAGLVKSYEVLNDAAVVELDGDQKHPRVLEVPIDECRELEDPARPDRRR